MADRGESAMASGAPGSLIDMMKVLEQKLQTAHQIALARMTYLGCPHPKSAEVVKSECDCGEEQTETFQKISGGLPSVFASTLAESFDYWKAVIERSKGIIKSPSSPENSSSSMTSSIQRHEIDEKRGKEQSAYTNVSSIVRSDATKLLHRVLNLHLTAKNLDPTFGEEVDRAGIQVVIHLILEQILLLLSVAEEEYTCEEDVDVLIDLQDVAYGVYPAHRGMPFTKDELLSRLPIVYDLTSVPACESASGAEFSASNGSDHLNMIILINQVTKRQSAQEDVGFVMWPSAIILSRWLLSNPQLLYGKSVLELGAGCGLVGLVAARIITNSQVQPEDGCEESSCKVTITDVNSDVLANIEQNIQLNEVDGVASVAKLDFYLQTGGNCSPGGWVVSDGSSKDLGVPVDIILAADIICKPEDAVAAAKTIHDVLLVGGVAFVVCADSKHRFGVECFASECEKVKLDVVSTDVGKMGFNMGEECCRNDGTVLSDTVLSDALKTTSGYVGGMKLTFFKVTKR